jgi:H+/Cl- antiporter ClcA
LVFWGGALAVGIVGVLFAAAATQVGRLFHLMAARPWVPLLLTPLGFTLSAWVALRFFPGSQGSGIPQAIAARSLAGTASLGLVGNWRAISGTRPGPNRAAW